MLRADRCTAGIPLAAGVALFFACGALPAQSPEQSEARLFAPMNEIGLRLEDWVAYLGPDYTIVDSRESPNPHTRHPMVFLRLSDGVTKVGFQVNLVTNDHFLMEVQSHSAEFLDKLGIDELPASPKDTITIIDDWDMGVNRLEIVRQPGGRGVAQWVYYVD